MAHFISIPENPIPENAEPFEFEAPGGVNIRGGFFPVDNPRGTVVLVTGWSEFIEKYFETIRDLHQRGLNVAMMDWRGQGLSDREQVKETKWNGYFQTIKNDLEFFTDTQVKPRFGGPYILMTHSMGGMPALKLLSTGNDGFSRAVLCAPMTRLFPEPQNKITGLAASIASTIGFARTQVIRSKDYADKFDGNIYTSDKARHSLFRDLRLAEPKAASQSPTYGWVNDAIKASKAIHADHALDGIKIPVLIITAGLEQQIDGEDHQIIAASSDKISVETIPGALHEIMMERDSLRALYWKAFDDFVAPVFKD
ncbi:alpha/beta hydrolase [Hyphococcus lacteus]|uniref:Alpha/beta hydrolase n=1 Tax=Hyphococcus lacteus TaxID=3143536 RepID=A0ABV3Z0Q5_9PROT